MGRNRTHERQNGTGHPDGRLGTVTDAPQKLRLLARQSRILAVNVLDGERAIALQSLAQLYEKQARELETTSRESAFS